MIQSVATWAASGAGRWSAEGVFAPAAAQAHVAQYVGTFAAHLSCAKPGGHYIDKVRQTPQSGTTRADCLTLTRGMLQARCVY